MQWLVVLPIEIIAATISTNFWDGQKHNHAVFVTIFLATIIIINLCGVKGFGEAEFVFSTIKVIAIVGYMLVPLAQGL
jgi:amino acid transporter